LISTATNYLKDSQETPKNVPPPSPQMSKEFWEERKIKFANNKIGAQVKPMVKPVQRSQSFGEEKKSAKPPLSIEESDRLLAFKLAQEEMEVMLNYYYENFNIKNKFLDG
jgi:hypothetical protein